MTIDLAVQWIWMVLLLLTPLAAWIGWRRVASAARLRYFLLRRERAIAGWRLIVLAFLLLLAALVVRQFGRTAAYAIVRPTPSITPTSTAVGWNRAASNPAA